MIPTFSTDHTQSTPTDDINPRFFLDDAFNTDLDSDWWLDLGCVDLPAAPSV